MVTSACTIDNTYRYTIYVQNNVAIIELRIHYNAYSV